MTGNSNNDSNGRCRSCGRDNRGHEHERCSDDCPQYETPSLAEQFEPYRNRIIGFDAVVYGRLTTRWARVTGYGVFLKPVGVPIRLEVTDIHTGEAWSLPVDANFIHTIMPEMY